MLAFTNKGILRACSLDTKLSTEQEHATCLLEGSAEIKDGYISADFPDRDARFHDLRQPTYALGHLDLQRNG